MIINPKAQQRFYSLLGLWFIVNLLQAIFTEINADEAYYALYGKHLSWGYFDHPPLVALIPYTSSIFFKGNLGVRLLTVLIQIPTLILIWKQLSCAHNATIKQVNTFFIVAASMVMFVVYGFTTTPDVWLLFFTAAFLFFYNKFLKIDSPVHTILLGLTMAGLVYSKYQGVILILLVLLSNLTLIKNYKFWLASIIGIVICLPHFYWQYSHDFPSFSYHLVGRSKPFKWSYFFEYLPNQLVTFNPFTMGAAAFIFFKFKPADLFERSLFYIIPGFIILFWGLTYKGHAEPQWTVAASIPMMILICNKAYQNNGLRKYIHRWIFGSLALIFIARVFLIAGLMPEKTQLSGKKEKIMAIEKMAGNQPVIFTGSYQNPSLYQFFTGKLATVRSSAWSRKSQFDLWKFDEQWAGKPVYISASRDSVSSKTIVDGVEVDGYKLGAYQYDGAIKMVFDSVPSSATSSASINFPLEITNDEGSVISFTNQQQPFKLVATFSNKKELFISNLEIPLHTASLRQGQTLKQYSRLNMEGIPKGEYQFALGFMNFAGPQICSPYQKMTVR